MIQCPKCQVEMTPIQVGGGEVDRCTACNGLWFDLLEHEDFAAHAAEIDVGGSASKQSSGQNAPNFAVQFATPLNCPRCANSPLIHMSVPQQPHIQFESCPVCYGRFLDAGEYRDMTEMTFTEWLKSVVGAWRR